MTLQWKTCFRVAVTFLIVYLLINYSNVFFNIIGVALGAAAPLLLGCVIAYIANILMSFWERTLFSKAKNRFSNAIRRPIAIILTFCSIVLVAFLLVNMILPELIECIHPDLKELFSKTRGILLYQEDSLHLFTYAGFPEDKQDTARRAIGKKKKDVMESLYADFKIGLENKKWTKQQIEDVWALLSKQAEYSFNHG
jgi:predicted PurR-regulated permease PerM